MGFGINNCHLVKTEPSAITSLVHSLKRLLIWMDRILHNVKGDAATRELRPMSISMSMYRCRRLFPKKDLPGSLVMIFLKMKYSMGSILI